MNLKLPFWLVMLHTLIISVVIALDPIPLGELSIIGMSNLFVSVALIVDYLPCQLSVVPVIRDVVYSSGITLILYFLLLGGLQYFAIGLLLERIFFRRQSR